MCQLRVVIIMIVLGRSQGNKIPLAIVSGWKHAKVYQKNSPQMFFFLKLWQVD